MYTMALSQKTTRSHLNSHQLGSGYTNQGTLISACYGVFKNDKDLDIIYVEK